MNATNPWGLGLGIPRKNNQPLTLRVDESFSPYYEDRGRGEGPAISKRYCATKYTVHTAKHGEGW